MDTNNKHNKGNEVPSDKRFENLSPEMAAKVKAAGKTLLSALTGQEAGKKQAKPSGTTQEKGV